MIKNNIKSYIRIIKPILLSFNRYSIFFDYSSIVVTEYPYQETNKLVKRIRLRAWILNNYLNPIYPNIPNSEKEVLKYLYDFLSNYIETNFDKYLTKNQRVAYSEEQSYLPKFFIEIDKEYKSPALNISLMHNNIKELETSIYTCNTKWKRFQYAVKQLSNSFMFIIRYPLIRLFKYIFRDRYIKTILKNKNFSGVFGSIDAVSDILNYFIFNKGICESIQRKTVLSELVSLAIQIGDEFIDQISIQIGVEKTIDIIKKNNSIFSIKYSHYTNTFSIEINLYDLENWGVDINEINDKYKITYKEIYNILYNLLAQINLKIQQAQSPKEIGEKIDLCFKHCLSTYYDDLLINQIGKDFKYSYSQTKWYYHKKTNGVMTAWLLLNSSLFNIDAINFNEKISEWGNLLYNFQLFDDLKDMKVDFGFQPNIAHIVAFQNFPDEFMWFRNNIDNFNENIKIDEIVRLSLEMPLTISNVLLISKYEALNNLKWFTLFLTNYRWKKNWTDSFLNFHNPQIFYNLLSHSSLVEFNHVINTQSKIVNIIFSCLLKIQHAFPSFENKRFFFDYLFSLCLYDSTFTLAFYFTNNPVKSYHLLVNYHFMQIGHKEKLLTSVIQSKKMYVKEAFSKGFNLIHNIDLINYIKKNWINE